MAEFGFYGAEEDRCRIIDAILALGEYGLVPDLHYPDSSPQIYESPEPALFEAIVKKKRLYITGPFSQASIFMEQVEGGKSDGSYYVDEARGGPLLVLSLPGCRVMDGLTELVPGNFFHRTEYWDDAITHPIKPSDELKVHYKLILGEIKRYLVRKKITEDVWIGVGAWELLNHGKAIILSKGKWWDGKGSFVRSNLDRPIAS